MDTFKQVCECLGWVALLVGFFYVMVFLTPPERYVSEDAFEEAVAAEEGAVR